MGLSRAETILTTERCLTLSDPTQSSRIGEENQGLQNLLRILQQYSYSSVREGSNILQKLKFQQFVQSTFSPDLMYRICKVYKLIVEYNNS